MTDETSKQPWDYPGTYDPEHLGTSEKVRKTMVFGSSEKVPAEFLKNTELYRVVNSEETTPIYFFESYEEAFQAGVNMAQTCEEIEKLIIPPDFQNYFSTPKFESGFGIGLLLGLDEFSGARWNNDPENKTNFKIFLKKE